MKNILNSIVMMLLTTIYVMPLVGMATKQSVKINSSLKLYPQKAEAFKVILNECDSSLRAINTKDNEIAKSIKSAIREQQDNLKLDHVVRNLNDINIKVEIFINAKNFERHLSSVSELIKDSEIKKICKETIKKMQKFSSSIDPRSEKTKALKRAIIVDIRRTVTQNLGNKKELVNEIKEVTSGIKELNIANLNKNDLFNDVNNFKQIILHYNDAITLYSQELEKLEKQSLLNSNEPNAFAQNDLNIFRNVLTKNDTILNNLEKDYIANNTQLKDKGLCDLYKKIHRLQKTYKSHFKNLAYTYNKENYISIDSINPLDKLDEFVDSFDKKYQKDLRISQKIIS